MKEELGAAEAYSRFTRPSGTTTAAVGGGARVARRSSAAPFSAPRKHATSSSEPIVTQSPSASWKARLTAPGKAEAARARRLVMEGDSGRGTLTDLAAPSWRHSMERRPVGRAGIRKGRR